MRPKSCKKGCSRFKNETPSTQLTIRDDGMTLLPKRLQKMWNFFAEKQKDTSRSKTGRVRIRWRESERRSETNGGRGM